MFDFYDVGVKMKKIARKFGTIGVILSVIYGIFTGYSIIKAGKMAVSIYDESAAVPAGTVFAALLAGAVIILIGCVCSYLSAMLWHSIGDCAENSEKMLVELYSIKKSLSGENEASNITKSSVNESSKGYSLGVSGKMSSSSGDWTCKNCGAKNSKTAFFCKDCGEHK